MGATAQTREATVPHARSLREGVDDVEDDEDEDEDEDEDDGGDGGDGGEHHVNHTSCVARGGREEGQVCETIHKYGI